MIKLQNFIGGEFLEPNTKKYHDVYNPSTGQVQERAEYLNKIADLIEKKAPELAKAEAQNVGKPYKLTLESDIGL
jgi:aminomuconate-semialdehyde/2-hydroxymuconate-6-semialdehyde dehydrogenase